MAKSKGKKLVYVSEGLIEGVAKISKNRGESVGKVVEDSLRQSVKVNEDGYDLKQVADFFNVMQAHRVLGGVFVPSSVLEYLIEVVYPDRREELLAKWFESGRWNGKYLKEKFDNPVKAFGCFLELSRWDLNEVEVKELMSSVKIRCVSTVLTNEGTELLARFIEGVMDGLGYKTERLDCLKGMIILESKI
ncbi:MAG TPA: hypothetical protein VJ066_01065 [Candidatus Bathyarchaeia archaeon]|nr:hypothetical protein [Candidatus Bathyarchaeia archaeon]